MKQTQLHTNEDTLRDVIGNIRLALDTLESVTKTMSVQEIAMDMMDDDSMIKATLKVRASHPRVDNRVGKRKRNP